MYILKTCDRTLVFYGAYYKEKQGKNALKSSDNISTAEISLNIILDII